MLLIFLLVSSLNTGDLNHGDAILEALADLNPKVIIIDASKTTAKDEYLRQLKTVPKDTKYITLAVGPLGQSFLSEIKKLDLDKQHNYIVLSIHQYTDLSKELVKNKVINHIALPEAILTNLDKIEISKINTSLLFAVPTKNPSLNELKLSYNTWITPNKPDLKGKYFIVNLPGDAPDSTGVIHRFTLKSARKLFNNIKELWKNKGRDHIILVQNGPRTGKYGSNGEVICSHEYNVGGDSSIAIDEISKQFVKWIEEESDMNYIFFNFSFENNGTQQKINSVYEPCLYIATYSNNNYFITPAGSTSMLSQIPLYIPANRNIVFKSDSMNSSHQNMLNLNIANKYVSYFDSNGTIITQNSLNLRYDEDTLKLSNDIKRLYKSID